MPRSHPKARKCERCGARLGMGEHVAVKVLDRVPERVAVGNGGYTRWRTETIASVTLCPPCAARAADRIKEYRK